MVAGTEKAANTRRTSSNFGDKRLDKQYEHFTQAIATQQQVCINRLAANHGQRIGFYRFLDNESVRFPALLNHIQGQCAIAASGSDDLLVLHDTVQWDYSFHASHKQFGPIGNHDGRGYLSHISLAVSATTTTPLDIAAAHIWQRSLKLPANKPKKYRVAFQQKESARWFNACQQANELLDRPLRQLVHVQDREGDLYDSFVLAAGKHQLLIRSRSDRLIQTPQGQQCRLSTYLEGLPPMGLYCFEVKGDCGKKQKRTALMQLRYSQINLVRPKQYAYQKNYPQHVPVYVIEARELPATVPVGETPVYWRLLSTLPVENQQQAQEKISWYTRRWLIEELFRLLKKEGFALETCQLKKVDKLKKIMMLAMASAVKVLQLKQARDGESEVPLQAAFTTLETECLEQLEPGLEGKTEKQQNPHPKKTLAWAAWIIARLGGWKGYASQRKPGVITLQNGLERFEQIFFGWKMNIKT